jgi:hypothetical protein
VPTIGEKAVTCAHGPASVLARSSVKECEPHSKNHVPFGCSAGAGLLQVGGWCCAAFHGPAGEDAMWSRAGPAPGAHPGGERQETGAPLLQFGGATAGAPAPTWKSAKSGFALS